MKRIHVVIISVVVSLFLMMLLSQLEVMIHSLFETSAPIGLIWLLAAIGITGGLAFILQYNHTLSERFGTMMWSLLSTIFFGGIIFMIWFFINFNGMTEI